MDISPPKLTMAYTDERMIPESSNSPTFWEHIHRYRFAAMWVKDKRVLDIASGEGYGSFGLLGAGAKSIIGVDVDGEACAHAARKYGIEARIGSAEEIPVETASIDVVVSFETIEHVPNPKRFVQEISRVLAPGGLLIISTPDTSLYSPAGSERNPYHCSEMTSNEFQSLLSSAFPKVRLFGQHPGPVRWWSPMRLLSESCPWDRLPQVRGIRQGLLAKWNPERAIR